MPMRSRRVPVFGLVLALLFQMTMVAAMPPALEGCCSGQPASTAVVAVAPCCEGDESDIPAWTDPPALAGVIDRAIVDASIAAAPTADTLPCPGCDGDCGTLASPAVLTEPMTSTLVSAAFELPPLQAVLRAAPAPHRLERPPSGPLA